MAVKLLNVFWASLNPRFRIPPEARIKTLPELEIAARGDTGVDFDAVRRLVLGLPELAVAPPKSGVVARTTEGGAPVT